MILAIDVWEIPNWQEENIFIGLFTGVYFSYYSLPAPRYCNNVFLMHIILLSTTGFGAFIHLESYKKKDWRKM